MSLTEQELRLNPEYAEAESEYITASTVARRSDDELASMRAELQWTRKGREIADRLNAEHERGVSMTAIKEQAKKDYPQIPEALYEAITDPVQLARVISDLSKEFDKATTSGQNWGPAGAGAGAGASRRNRDGERAALIDRANHGDPQALREFKSGVWAEKVASNPLLTRNINRQK